VLGPLSFIAAWAIGGFLRDDGYSPVDDAISRLASVGADTQPLMTLGFLGYAVGLVVYGVAIRRSIGTASGVAAMVSGLATLGVALTPLDASDTVDTLHGVTAGTGYVAIALTALLAIRPMVARGERTWALGAALAGGTAAVSLLLTTVTDANGLFQRLGLTAGDVWIMASAVRFAARPASAQP
jgi:hypothetical protein